MSDKEQLSPRIKPPINNSLTFDEVNKLLKYENGKLYWKISRGGLFAGAEAGCVDTYGGGYVVLTVCRRKLMAHRLIWLLVTGGWPKLILDHINGDRADNRFENLRECNYRQNQGNRKHKGPLPRGVSLSKGPIRPYEVTAAGKYVGCFKTMEEAGMAYDIAAIKHFGEFANLNYPEAHSK